MSRVCGRCVPEFYRDRIRRGDPCCRRAGQAWVANYAYGRVGPDVGAFTNLSSVFKKSANEGYAFLPVVQSAIVPISERAPQLPEDIREIIDRMLATKAPDRPDSMREISAVLARHTDIRAETFGVPIPPAEHSAPPAVTAGAFVQTDPAVVEPSKSKKWLPWAVIAALAIVTLPVGASVAYQSFAAAPVEPVASVSSSMQLDDETALSDAAVEPTKDAGKEAAPGASASAAGSTVRAVATTAPKSASHPPKPQPTKIASPKETAAPAATPTKLPGGIVEDMPF